MSYRVKQLAVKTGVSPDTVRYYTKLGLLRPTRNEENAYRIYDQHDLNRLNFICRAKNLGYSLHEIMQIFDEAGKGESPCPLVRELIHRHIQINRAKLAELIELQERMEMALAKWENMPDGVPDGDSVCHLIDSFGGI